MGVCGLCNGKGKIREEAHDPHGNPMRNEHGKPVMVEAICPQCGGWSELLGRFVDEKIPTGSEKTSRKKKPMYTKGGSRGPGGKRRHK